MISRIWSVAIAVSLAVSVFIAYSVPVRALPGPKSNNKFSASTTIAPGDDDDDGLSGGALAVLLLAIGGAVAGVLYAQSSPSQGSSKYPPLAFQKAADSTIKVTMEDNNGEGNPTHIEWTARVDERSRTIKVTKNKTDRGGKPTHSEWTGKVDGKFYPVTGDPKSEELSYTNIDARTLGFTARKAGRITLTGQIVASANGRSFTMTMNGISSTRRRVNSRAVYDLR